jgi:hypothetical protein
MYNLFALRISELLLQTYLYVIQTLEDIYP